MNIDKLYNNLTLVYLMNYPKSVLFICRGNERRSPTAEYVFKQSLNNRGYEHSNKPHEKEIYVDSAGVNVDSCSENWNAKQMTKELGDLAERIFTFNKNLEVEIIRDYHQSPSKIINLDVADRWPCGHPALIKELEEKLGPYVLGWYPQKAY